jgi:hypothetical protein
MLNLPLSFPYRFFGDIGVFEQINDCSFEIHDHRATPMAHQTSL